MERTEESPIKFRQVKGVPLCESDARRRMLRQLDLVYRIHDGMVEITFLDPAVRSGAYGPGFEPEGFVRIGQCGWTLLLGTSSAA